MMKRFAVLGAIVVSGLAAVGVTAQGLPGITEDRKSTRLNSSH